MDLFSVTVTGFRRFKEPTSLRTVGKVLAILGPNEAGKSSILQAISYLGTNEPLPPRATTRGLDPSDTKIFAKFLLSEADLKDAALTGPRWFAITKLANGSRTWSFEPPAPRKDLDHRTRLFDSWKKILDSDSLFSTLENHQSVANEQVMSTLEELQKAPDSSSEKLKKKLKEILDICTSAYSSERSSLSSTFLSALSNAVEREAEQTPGQKAAETLWSKIPQILFFDDESRDLRTNYSINDLRNDIPLALANLFEVADLNLNEIFKAIDGGNNSAIATIEHKANRILEKRFSEAWRQSDVRVAFRFSGDLLEIQVVDENTEFTSFDERSDGLRQFVALQSFVTCNWADNPILLIDEAEQRLHYDAQADLAQMLSKQSVASKVIYTTHSAGCLPEDLGNGVRLVRPIKSNPTFSEVKNKFWTLEGDGFAPLLYGMGASTLAFFPTRRAVMVEGPVDMLLYPSMMREVLQSMTLGFQFVPGLSIAQHPPTPLILRHESGVCYLIDGDKGGQNLQKQLREKGVPEKAIFLLKNHDGTAIELEDYIRPELLISACNRLLSTFFPKSEPINSKELNAKQRMASLEVIYKSRSGADLPKVELAYEILNIVESAPGESILDPRRRKTFEALANGIVKFFAGSKT